MGYYNVTVNFVVKRLPNYDAEQKHKDYLASASRKKGAQAPANATQSLDAGFQQAAIQLHEKEDATNLIESTDDDNEGVFTQLAS